MIHVTELEIQLPHHSEFTVGDCGDRVRVTFGGYRFRSRIDETSALEGRFGQLELANVDVIIHIARDSGDFGVKLTGTSLPAVTADACICIANQTSVDESDAMRLVYENLA